MEKLIKRYKTAKENIENDPELKSKIDEYKKMHIAYQRRASGLLPLALPSFDEEKAVSKFYWNLMLNENAKEFLESEKELIETAAQKFGEIADSCEIDFSFMI